MGDDSLDEAIRAAQNALGHRSEAVEFPAPDWSQFSGEDDPMSNGTSSDKGEGAEVATPSAPRDGNHGATVGVQTDDPVWIAVRGVKAIDALLPGDPSGKSRLGRCIDQMRHTSERELFSNAESSPLYGENLHAIEYPRLEINKVVGETRALMLALLPNVEFEGRLRELLAREVAKPGAFLEEDDRGTIQGWVEPTGPTNEKMRNDTKLHALGVFLDALRRQPFAVVRCVVTLLGKVSVPPDILSVDTGACVVTFRRTQYPVSDLTAHFVQLLLKADGGLVSTKEVARAAGVAGQARPDRMKEKLPGALVAAIVTTKQGSCLNKDRLLSYV
jgi:hypothetical protein